MLQRKSSFFYGCTDEANPIASRILPLMLSKITNMFSFTESRFQIDKVKETTARVTQWKEHRIPNVFTLEASFFGYDSENGPVHYTQRDFMDIGKSLCRAIYAYVAQVRLGMADRVIEVTADSQTQTTVITAESIIDCLKNNPDLIACGAVNDEASGSDSNPSEDELPSEQAAKILPKGAKIKFLKRSNSKSSLSQKKSAPQIVVANPKEGDQGQSKDTKSGQSFKIKSKLSSLSNIVMNLQPKPQQKTSSEKVDMECQTEEFFFDMILFLEGKRLGTIINTKTSDLIEALQKNELVVLTARNNILLSIF